MLGLIVRSFIGSAAAAAGATAVARKLNQNRQGGNDNRNGYGGVSAERQVVFYSDSDRVFGVAGSSLENTNGAISDDLAQVGIKGEVKAAKRIEALAAMYPNTYVFHSLKLPGAVGDMDHVVVQGNRVLLIDSKNWRGNAAYEIVDTDEYDTNIYRDGEEFLGGEVHLTRQMIDWRNHIGGVLPLESFEAAIVITSRGITVSSQVDSPFYLSDLEGLKDAFEGTFTMNPVSPLHPLTLEWYLEMLQGYNYCLEGTNPAPAIAGARNGQYVPVKEQADATVWGFVAWSCINYFILAFIPILSVISAIVLIVFTHRKRGALKASGKPGKGLLLTTLIFSYLLVAITPIAVLSFIALMEALQSNNLQFL